MSKQTQLVNNVAYLIRYLSYSKRSRINRGKLNNTLVPIKVVYFTISRLKVSCVKVTYKISYKDIKKFQIIGLDWVTTTEVRKQDMSINRANVDVLQDVLLHEGVVAAHGQSNGDRQVRQGPVANAIQVHALLQGGRDVPNDEVVLC